MKKIWTLVSSRAGRWVATVVVIYDHGNGPRHRSRPGHGVRRRPADAWRDCGRQPDPVVLGEDPRQQRFLRVQPVLGLIKHH